MRNGSKTFAGGGPFWPDIPMSEGGSAAHSWPPMPLKWLKFLVGMVRIDQWDRWDMSDVYI